jgi:saccharopine dehydrogenase (NAD+, L-lysine-forming)
MTMKSIWLRHEIKQGEKRTPLTPDSVKKLTSKNITVYVEKSNTRIFKDSEYEQNGAILKEPASWSDAPTESFILGLKELPETLTPLTHKHIYFAHAFKNQDGANELLSRFKEGNGQLFDLEFLLDANDRRVAAFGYWAGYVGAALSLLNYYEPTALTKLKSFKHKDELISFIKKSENSGTRPKVIIIGSRGRCGSGARELFSNFNVEVTAWDKEQTSSGGPFEKILDHHIFINTVLLQSNLGPFLTKDIINKNQKLSVIGDVSCDPNNKLNPIPIYDQITTWDQPFGNYLINEKEISILAIDNLPSVLPLESSEDYDNQLYPYLEDLILSENLPIVWSKALKLFQDKLD